MLQCKQLFPACLSPPKSGSFFKGTVRLIVKKNLCLIIRLALLMPEALVSFIFTSLNLKKKQRNEPYRGHHAYKAALLLTSSVSNAMLCANTHRHQCQALLLTAVVSVGAKVVLGQRSPAGTALLHCVWEVPRGAEWDP